MTTSAKWSLVGVVVILAVVVALLPQLLSGSGSTSGDGNSDQATSAGDGTGEASTSMVANRPDCPAGNVAGINLPCLGGETGEGNDLATVVNVWAWWCEPCRDELPVFEEFAATHPELNVVGVHADTNAANGAAMLTDLGVDLPSYQDDSNLFAGTLGLPAVVPITVVLDSSAEVVEIFPRTFDSLGDLEAAVGGVL